MLSRFLDSQFITIAYPILLAACVVAGYLIAKRRYVKKNKEWKATGIESAVIGIFSLLLSFTFLASNNSLKDRSKLVHETSDATADLRRLSLFMADDIKTATRIYLQEYLAFVYSFNLEYVYDKDALMNKAANINGKYLTLLTERGKISEQAKQEALLLLPQFNKVNSSFYKLLYSYTERIPILIIILILFSSFLIGILIGFMNGFYQQRHYLVPIIFIVMVTLCVQAIRDLDNPYSGNIKLDFSDFKYQEEVLKNSTR
jgi:ABC-type dipeptide/oligopeptide/nickel transport system permease subunit